MKMIKKILILVAVLMVAAGSAFASGGRYTAITFSAPYNTLTEKATIYGIDITSSLEYSDIGFGIVSTNVNRGIFKPYTSVDISFTQSMKWDSVSVSKDQMKRADYSTWKMNALFGPAFEVVDTGSMNLLLAPGIHFDMIQTKSRNNEAAAFIMTFGLGADAMFNWFISDGFGIAAGVGFAYDFFGISDVSMSSKAKSNGDTYKYTNITITPRVGIAIKY